MEGLKSRIPSCPTKGGLFELMGVIGRILTVNIGLLAVFVEGSLSGNTVDGSEIR